MPKPIAVDHTAAGGRKQWMQEHATQGALLATVIAGSVARALKRGRRS